LTAAPEIAILTLTPQQEKKSRMTIDPYASCPCGSGKKFKWCCQPIHAEIEKAMRLDQEGQHDTALRLMEDITRAHSANPEAFGRQAQILYQNDQVEAAESALDKAFAINPDYPFGHLLRALFRQQEGEWAGALILYRKAAELYDPEARDILAQIYSSIGELELLANRPVAAHAALRMALRFRPDDALRQGLDNLFTEKSHLPAPARQEYTFLPYPEQAPPERRSAWDNALRGAATGKLADAARAFQELCESDPENAAAWYNLGIVRAWLGDNLRALEALDKHVSLEPDESKAAAAWSLAEVLRLGDGMEDYSDYVEHDALYEIRNPQMMIDFLQRWDNEQRLGGVKNDEEQRTLMGIVLDREGGLVQAGANVQPGRFGTYFALAGGYFRLWTTNREVLERIRHEAEQSAGASLSEPRRSRKNAKFSDVFIDALIFPLRTEETDKAQAIIREHGQRYLEEQWARRSLKSLSGTTPLDAAGHANLRKKLLGAVQFLEACAAGPNQTFDFDRLRHKLGIGPKPAGEAVNQQLAFDAMSAADLAALAIEKLDVAQLDQAQKAAQKLDAQELGVHFAKALVARPAASDSDRYATFAYLVQQSLANGDFAAARGYVDSGEKHDCEHNEGRRRNDFELRRGQVLAKQGEAGAAKGVFERLIHRSPDDFRFRAAAAESMLSLKHGADALRFAEEGLQLARAKNNRDSEQHFMELAAAARKQIA
jgi:tetratricopeptide (TPR) repeat protein